MYLSKLQCTLLVSSHGWAEIRVQYTLLVSDHGWAEIRVQYTLLLSSHGWAEIRVHRGIPFSLATMQVILCVQKTKPTTF